MGDKRRQENTTPQKAIFSHKRIFHIREYFMESEGDETTVADLKRMITIKLN
jgi:hypothetical protein